MSKTKNNKIRTCELFGGVGGFRLGLKGWNGKSSTSGYKEDLNSKYEVVFSNQWEPSTKIQHASMVRKLPQKEYGLKIDKKFINLNCKNEKESIQPHTDCQHPKGV